MAAGAARRPADRANGVNPMRRFLVRADFFAHDGTANETYMLVASSRALAISRARQAAMGNELMLSPLGCATVAVCVVKADPPAAKADTNKALGRRRPT